MLGPTYLHFYELHNCYQYAGRVLMELRSECLNNAPAYSMTSRDISMLDEKTWWQNETFIVEFMLHQGDFVHINGSNCKISIRLAG